MQTFHIVSQCTMYKSIKKFNHTDRDACLGGLLNIPFYSAISIVEWNIQSHRYTHTRYRKSQKNTIGTI